MDVQVNAPKKSSNSTYTCALYDGTDQKIECQIPGCYVISLDKNILFIKTDKKSLDCFSELGSTVVDLVKDNFKTWFPSSSISDDFIEEYFSDVIIYRKRYGDLLRLKFKDDSGFTEIPLKKRMTITVVLNNIRIYKQKFVLEWVMKTSDVADDSDSSLQPSDDDVEVDIPVDEVREEYLTKVGSYINKLTQELDRYYEFRTLLERANIGTISKICDVIDHAMDKE